MFYVHPGTMRVPLKVSGSNRGPVARRATSCHAAAVHSCAAAVYRTKPVLVGRLPTWTSIATTAERGGIWKDGSAKRLRGAPSRALIAPCGVKDRFDLLTVKYVFSLIGWLCTGGLGHPMKPPHEFFLEIIEKRSEHTVSLQ